MNPRRALLASLIVFAAAACGDGIEQLVTRTAESPSGSAAVAETGPVDDETRTLVDGPIPHQMSNVNRSWDEAVEVTYAVVSPAAQDWERTLSLEIAVHESVIRDLDLVVRYFLPEAPDKAQLSGAMRVEGGTRPGTSIFWRAGTSLPAAVVEPGAPLELCGVRRGSLPYDMTEATVYDCSEFTVGEVRDVASVWQPDIPWENDPAFDIDQTGGVTLSGGGIEITLAGTALPSEPSQMYPSLDFYVLPVTATTTNSVPTVLPSIYSTIFTESGRICETSTVWETPIVPSRAQRISPGESIETDLVVTCERRELPDPTRPDEFALIPRPIPRMEQALLVVGTRGLIESNLKLLISISN